MQIDDCVEGRLDNSLCCGVWLRPPAGISGSGVGGVRGGGGGGGGPSTLLAAATIHLITAGGGSEGRHLLLVRQQHSWAWGSGLAS